MRFLTYIVTIILIASCAVERPTGKTEAEVIFLEAKELIGDKRYIMANEKLNIIRSQFPYSIYSTQAELLQADILFMQENYEEAAAAYILFKDFHPKNRKMDYVIFKIAESYYNQLPDTHDRDLSPGIKAMKYYNELRSLYPNSSLLKDANQKIEKVENMLVAKEKYIADFYFRTEDYQSAKFRYEGMLRSSSMPALKSLAIIRLMKIGKATMDLKLCRTTYTKYRSNIQKTDIKEAKNIYASCSK